jgi:hypothetical protein
MKALNSKHLPSPERLRAGRPNHKEIPMIQIQNFKQNRFGHSDWVVGIHLGLGIWNFGFKMVN